MLIRPNQLMVNHPAGLSREAQEGAKDGEDAEEFPLGGVE
jgi:hypothetical protein